jgi:septal ring factor EnvC (AmiA/AmiB activator)
MKKEEKLQKAINKCEVLHRVESYEYEEKRDKIEKEIKALETKAEEIDNAISEAYKKLHELEDRWLEIRYPLPWERAEAVRKMYQ